MKGTNPGEKRRGKVLGKRGRGLARGRAAFFFAASLASLPWNRKAIGLSHVCTSSLSLSFSLSLLSLSVKVNLIRKALIASGTRTKRRREKGRKEGRGGKEIWTTELHPVQSSPAHPERKFLSTLTGLAGILTRAPLDRRQRRNVAKLTNYSLFRYWAFQRC